MGQDESSPARAASEASRRGRLVAAAGAAFVLAALVGVVIATGSSDSAAEIDNECILAWNEDPVAPGKDGIHAYTAHGYRATLATRVDASGDVIGDPPDEGSPDDPEARCAVIFAAPQFDFEPGFGVFVYREGVWAPLTILESVSIEEIEEIQADALPVTNATLLESGKLTED